MKQEITLKKDGFVGIFDNVFDEGYIDTLPKITMIKEVKQKPKYINEAKWNKIMELTCVDPFYKDVFDLYRTTGARRSEIILGHLEGNFLIVEAQDSKTRRELEIPLSPLQAATVREIHKRILRFLWRFRVNRFLLSVFLRLLLCISL